MEITLPHDLEIRLDRLAEERGSDRASLIAEAVARLVDHEAWFLAEVEQGLADLGQGRVLGHEEVGARLERGCLHNSASPAQLPAALAPSC